MRFTFLVHDRQNYRAGPLVSMERLLPRLKQRGHDVRILGLVASQHPTLDRLQVEEGIVVDYMPQALRYTEDRVLWILTRLQSCRPDIFVPNSFVCGFYAARWAREAGIPTIGYLRSNDRFHWDMVSQFVLGGAQWALSGLPCVSRSLERQVNNGGLTKTRTCFLPSGVPLSSRIANQASGNMRVCYAGRFEQTQKRIRETVVALFRNLRKGVCQHVGFFGSGSEAGWLSSEISRQGLDDRVTLHGSVPSGELQAGMSRYNVVVLLSDYEGTPGAVMDGMSAGLVPVTTMLPDGTSELVRDGVTGLQCRDREADFDRCLQELAASPQLRQRLARKARHRIQETYSLDSTVDRFELFAEQLLSEAGPRTEIKTPVRIRLPVVFGELSREDIRRPVPPLITRIRGRIVSALPTVVRSTLRKIIPR